MNIHLRAIGLIALIMMIAFANACTWVPRNDLPLHQRSAVIENEAAAEQILAKAKLVESNDPAVNNIKVLHLSGTPYEMGFQHGRLIQEDVKASALAQAVWDLLEDPERCREISRRFATLRDDLALGADERAAEAVIELAG